MFPKILVVRGWGVRVRQCFKDYVPQVTRQVSNLFQDLWNKFLGFFSKGFKCPFGDHIKRSIQLRTS